MAQANNVLLDSLVAQRVRRHLIVVGRGVPAAWLVPGSSLSVTNFPALGGHRIGVMLTSTGRAVTLRLTGPLGRVPVRLELPALAAGIAGTSSGLRVPGAVVLAPGTRSITVLLRHPARPLR